MTAPFTAALLLAAATGAAAAPEPRPAPWEPAASVPAIAYRSAFEHYRRHAEQPLSGWKDLNEATRRAGGWRAYTREARPPVPAEKAR